MATKPSGALTVTAVHDYVASYTDADVTTRAHTDGAAAVHNAAVWGANTHPYTADEICAAHETTVELVGHTLRKTAQGLTVRIREVAAGHGFLVNDAVRAIDAWHTSTIHLAEARHVRRLLGLGTPSQLIWLKQAVLWLVLFAGDLFLLATAFQTLGLSDERWVSWFPFGNDLYVAALASVTVLAVSAHQFGIALKHLQHDNERRRLAPDDRARDRLPKTSRTRLGIATFFMAVAGAVLIGIVQIRVAYMSATDQPMNTVSFTLLQIGLIGGAVYVGFHFCDPSAKACHAAAAAETTAARAKSAAVAQLVDAVSQHNMAIDELDAEIANAGHHVLADAANVVRQVAGLYPAQVILAQPEPEHEALFPHGFPAPAAVESHELYPRLVGLTDLPAFAPLSTGDVIAHEARAIASVRAREAVLLAIETGRPNTPSGETTTSETAAADVDGELPHIGSADSSPSTSRASVDEHDEGEAAA